MLATGTQLILRSVPFVATVGPDGMAATYDWDEKEVGWVFASFGWGCTCTAALFRAFSLNQGSRCTDALSQIPGSMLSVKYGAKYTWWVFLMGAGFFNFCVPIAGSLAPMFGFEPLYGVMLCRFMFGSFQGSLFPIQTAILAGWLHVKERSTITAAVGCCWSFFQVRPVCKKPARSPVLTCVAVQAVQAAWTPYFMEGSGWQYAFYTYSMFVFVWGWFWHKYVPLLPDADDPAPA